ncbi:phosphatase PAP2 family protein [Microbacterium foliorum]|uniref:Undecaprenyl pyrophosphate phosphatase n=2 Tax=Microbacterium foliorum TaxID=104336 RepID=A0A0F0KGW8_9MICO|nr:phosphatase PAP2 family protein [Microbacterium foliorum]KJL20103.1 undecaprenyl pyrophosphate phosphatase [Microbacterium foliorum]
MVEIMPSRTVRARRLAPLIVVAVAATALILVPAPGSLSVVGTKWLSSFGLSIPRADLVFEVTLVLLALAAASVIGWVWWKHPSQRPRAVVASIGVVLAYVTSEALKALFAQARPCSRWVTAAECPPAGDWSLPSNHATLAFGAVAVVAVLLARSALTWAMVGVAVLVAVGRVVEGVHYVHDVAIGALLGMALPLLLTLVFDASRRRRNGSPRRRDVGSDRGTNTALTGSSE